MPLSVSRHFKNAPLFVKVSIQIKRHSLRKYLLYLKDTLLKCFKRVKVKRFYGQWEWSLHCLIWCQKKSDFSWGFDGLYSRLAWQASYLQNSPGPRKHGTQWSSQSELFIDQSEALILPFNQSEALIQVSKWVIMQSNFSFMTFFICPQTIVNSWFTA